MAVLEVLGLEKEYTSRSGGNTVRALRGEHAGRGEYLYSRPLAKIGEGDIG